MNVLGFLPLALAGFLPSAALAAAVQDAGAWLVERNEVRHEVAEHRAVTVRNPWGNVVVRPGDEEELLVLSLAQRHRDDPRVSAVTFGEEGDSVVVRVEYPEIAIAEPVGEWERRRVDLTVLVPPESSLTVVTEDDDIEVKGVHGPFSATSVRGAIRALVGGRVEASTEHGELAVHFLNTAWSGPSRLTTRTGPITAELPAGGAARVSFRTSGSLTTDYSVTIDRDPASGLKTGTAAVGEGGPVLAIESDRGPVTLMASPVPEGAAGEVD